MRRWGVVVLLAIGGVMTVGGCGSGSPDASVSASAEQQKDLGVEELRPKASKVTDELAANDFAAVHADFDDTMKSKLAEDGLANAWKSIVTEKGAYQSRGEPSQQATPAGQDLFVFDTPVEFERGAMKSRVVFHPDGTIAGLFILKPDAG